MGRLAAGRYATNSRLSDVSVENAILDTFSFTSTTQLAPLRLKTQPRTRPESKLPLRTGPDGVPRTARRSGDPMSIRWARSPSPAYLNNGSRAIPKPSPAVDLRDRMRSASPFLQSEQGKKWGPKKKATAANTTPARGVQLSQSMDTRKFPTGASSRKMPAAAEEKTVVPWASTSNEDLFPYACKRCNSCQAYQNGVSEIVGTSLKVCPWVISMDRSVRQVNAHLNGYAKGEPEPDPRRESTYSFFCRSGFLGAEDTV